MELLWIMRQRGSLTHGTMQDVSGLGTPILACGLRSPRVDCGHRVHPLGAGGPSRTSRSRSEAPELPSGAQGGGLMVGTNDGPGLRPKPDPTWRGVGPEDVRSTTIDETSARAAHATMSPFVNSTPSRQRKPAHEVTRIDHRNGQCVLLCCVAPEAWEVVHRADQSDRSQSG